VRARPRAHVAANFGNFRPGFAKRTKRWHNACQWGQRS